MNTDPAKISEHIAMQNSKVLDYTGNDPNERQRRMKTAWRLQNRKDSFYFLQNTIVKNQMEKHEIARQQVSLWVEYVFFVLNSHADNLDDAHTQRDHLIAEQQRRQVLEERAMMRQRAHTGNNDRAFLENLH